MFLKIDTDRHPALAKKYGVVGLPDVRLLTPDGSEEKKLLGFRGPVPFAAELERLLDPSRKK